MSENAAQQQGAVRYNTPKKILRQTKGATHGVKRSDIDKLLNRENSTSTHGGESSEIKLKGAILETSITALLYKIKYFPKHR